MALVDFDLKLYATLFSNITEKLHNSMLSAPTQINSTKFIDLSNKNLFPNREN